MKKYVLFQAILTGMLLALFLFGTQGYAQQPPAPPADEATLAQPPEKPPAVAPEKPLWSGCMKNHEVHVYDAPAVDPRVGPSITRQIRLSIVRYQRSPHGVLKAQCSTQFERNPVNLAEIQELNQRNQKLVEEVLGAYRQAYEKMTDGRSEEEIADEMRKQQLRQAEADVDKIKEEWKIAKNRLEQLKKTDSTPGAKSTVSAPKAPELTDREKFQLQRIQSGKLMGEGLAGNYAIEMDGKKYEYNLYDFGCSSALFERGLDAAEAGDPKQIPVVIWGKQDSRPDNGTWLADNAEVTCENAIIP